MFIGFLAVALVSLVAALYWELQHPDPVVEIGLLKNRNFAIASFFYFLFGFVLFGSTVLIPQMLQSLFGYTATLAGLVLGPGALVIVALAPVVVRLVKRVPVGALIGFGFTVLSLAMLFYASFNLETNYGKEALARAVQGFGLAFLFVPTSQLAYSCLPKNKNNKASSLTNLFRNQGGSFGIAFVTTMVQRRSQFHETVLSVHASALNPIYVSRIAQLTEYFRQQGDSTAVASQHASAQLYALLERQSAMLSFADVFWLLGLIALVGPMAALLIRKIQRPGSAPAH
jgi:MFS transporter, DHA2 family, multidrug resistance protein